MKQTQFYGRHLELGAKMVPFAGFQMPVEYSGVNQEHINVRENVGIFDVSHMGELWITGPDAFELVQRITSNDVSMLEPGKIQYSCFPNENGGIVDDLLVYMSDRKTYLLVVNASNIEKDYQWVLKQNINGAAVDNASDGISQLAIQGPRATELVQRITDINLAGIAYYHFVTGKVAGEEGVIVSNTGYTGAGGFELYIPNHSADKIWEKLFEAGEGLGLQPAGLAARDTLRLEMGFCLYGNDIDDHTSPLEAGLGWITKFTEGNDFVSRKILERQKTEGVGRRLVGFELLERGIPRQHYPIFDPAGNPIGEVTSGTMSPMLKKGIGMGYVELAHSAKDSEIRIGIRDKQIPAKVVKPPFYKPQEN
jgi:aminomethyltransferase